MSASGARPRKAIVSIGTGPQTELLHLAARSFGPYAERHGYDLHLHEEPVERTRPVPWSKIPLLRELNARYDVLVWLDADLVIVDGRRDIAEDLPSGALLGLVQHRNQTGLMPNTGVFVLRCGPDAERFLADVWAQEDLIEHRWWENAAVCRLLGYTLDPVAPGPPTDLLARTHFLDEGWNSIGLRGLPRARIRHYPGFAVRTRAMLMRRDLVRMRLQRALGR